MSGKIVFIEVPGGSDKGPDGMRRDTFPMVKAMWDQGWDAEVVFYEDAKRHEVFRRIAKADAYVSRVNPGNIPGGEAQYLEMLRYLSASGVLGFAEADTMLELGAKDALSKLTDSAVGLPDTQAYYDFADFQARFPASLATGERVLKQNRGSTGQGIWHVKVVDERSFADGPLPLDTQLKCVEAVDNHVEHTTLGAFMEFCQQYLVGEQAMIVDMQFMPRIKEGEIRVLMVADEPVFVVHKKPADAADAFSATLFSGAKYTYDAPEKWPELINLFLGELPSILEKLGGHRVPLIWTADFMLDDGPDGKDAYVLGEINCSCVGFTSHLDLGIQDKVAQALIKGIEANRR